MENDVIQDISAHMDRLRTIHLNGGFYLLLEDQAKKEGMQTKDLLEKIVLDHIANNS